MMQNRMPNDDLYQETEQLTAIQQEYVDGEIDTLELEERIEYLLIHGKDYEALSWVDRISLELKQQGYAQDEISEIRTSPAVYNDILNDLDVAFNNHFPDSDVAPRLFGFDLVLDPEIDGFELVPE